MDSEVYVYLFLAALFAVIIWLCSSSLNKISERQFRLWNEKMDLIESHLSHYDEIVLWLKEGKSVEDVLKILADKNKDGKSDAK